MKNKIYILALLILTTLSSCSDKQKKVSQLDPIQVKLSTPINTNQHFFNASGKIEAVQHANLSTRMMGFVDQILVKVGQKVSKGQLLLSINSTDIMAKKAQVSASILEATVAFKNVEKDYNRFTELYKTNSLSQKEMDDMTANFKMAKARLESAKQMKNQINSQLDYANIKAPFTGIITGKYINKGAMANPGVPLLSIESPTNFQVTALISEVDITKIKEQQTVKVLVKSLNEIINGTVSEISQSDINTNGQYLVKIKLDKSDTKIVSGMFTSIQFSIQSASENLNSILIPKNALVHQGQLSGIYTVSTSNTAILRWLKLGKSFGNNIEILAGLNKNEQYIISANKKLFNGAPIKVQQ